MVKSRIINSILDNNHQDAFSIWNSNEKECRELLSKSKLKNNFLRLLSLNKQVNINGLSDYLMKQQYYQDIKTSYAKNLSEKLNLANIKHVFIKGPAVANKYYKMPFDRNFSDLDILISLKNSEEFYKFLDDQNFKHRNNINFLNRIGYTRTAIEVVNTGEHLIDFHHRIFSKFHKKNVNYPRKFWII